MMKTVHIASIVALATLLCAAALRVNAQVILTGPGYYGFTDPTVTVTPYGVQPLGYGYNGYTGTGAPLNPDWEMLRAIYAQGYQDAMNAAAAQQNVNDTVISPPTGMTATPPRAAGRVPHGSDAVRMWRVGRGQVALRWQGDPRIASSVTFQLVDRADRPIRATTVNQLPAEIHFTPPANAVYYQAIVHYVDGATNTIMGRLPK